MRGDHRGCAAGPGRACEQAGAAFEGAALTVGPVHRPGGSLWSRPCGSVPECGRPARRRAVRPAEAFGGISPRAPTRVPSMSVRWGHVRGTSSAGRRREQRFENPRLSVRQVDGLRSLTHARAPTRALAQRPEDFLTAHSLSGRAWDRFARRCRRAPRSRWTGVARSSCPKCSGQRHFASVFRPVRRRTS